MEPELERERRELRLRDLGASEPGRPVLDDPGRGIGRLICRGAHSAGASSAGASSSTLSTLISTGPGAIPCAGGRSLPSASCSTSGSGSSTTWSSPSASSAAFTFSRSCCEPRAASPLLVTSAIRSSLDCGLLLLHGRRIAEVDAPLLGERVEGGVRPRQLLPVPVPVRRGRGIGWRLVALDPDQTLGMAELLDLMQ